MNNSLDLLKQKEKQTWWNAALIVVIYAIIQGISWDLFLKRYISDNIIGSLLSFLFGLAFILFWVKFSSYERNSLETLGFHKEKIGQNILYGLIGASLISIIIILIIFFSGGLTFSFSGYKNIVMLLLVIVLFLFQGLTEEVVFRGYLMNRIAASYGRWWGIFGNSIFFAVFHASNPGVSYLSSLNIFIISLMLSLLFWYSDNIVLVGVFHGTWNFVIAVIFGINISGIEVPYTILKASEKSSNIYLHGSIFGIEGSAVTTVVFLLLSLIIYMALYVKMFKKLANKN